MARATVAVAGQVAYRKVPPTNTLVLSASADPGATTIPWSSLLFVNRALPTYTPPVYVESKA